MKSRFFLSVPALLMLCLPVTSFAGTGILAVHSEPSGARIWIDGVEAGTAPYQNVAIPVGRHEIKAVMSADYPPQIQEVVVEEQTPQVILFRFERSKGAFVGREIVRSTKKYKGNVTFASVPVGAFISINGEALKKATPVGYTDVEVGHYSVEFQHEGKTLRSEFDVIQGETIKIVADFSAGKVNSRWEEERLRKEIEKQEAEKREAAKREEEARSLQLQNARQPAGAAAAVLPVAAVPGAAVSTGGAPQPAEGVPPYGELMITLDVRRDGNLKYADYFDLFFPRVPIDSLSGPQFPAASAIGESTFKNGFEFMNDALADRRQFTARIDFTVRDTTPMERQVKSGVLTIREGKYDLKIARRRLADRFFSVEKVAEANAQEPLEIVRGNRLIVQIGGRIDGENKFLYEIKRTYEALTSRKGSSEKKAAAQESPGTENKTLPLFQGIQE